MRALVRTIAPQAQRGSYADSNCGAMRRRYRPPWASSIFTTAPVTKSEAGETKYKSVLSICAGTPIRWRWNPFVMSPIRSSIPSTRLRHAIERRTFPVIIEGRHGSDVDDSARLVGIDQSPRNFAREDIGRPKIGVEDLIDEIERHLVRPFCVRNACIVHEDIDLSKRLLRLMDYGRQLIQIGDVECERCPFEIVRPYPAHDWRERNLHDIVPPAKNALNARVEGAVSSSGTTIFLMVWRSS
jgi:hypothetical protein